MIKGDIRGWVLKLSNLHFTICHNHRIELRMPIISINRLGKSTLGTWNKEKREIAISYDFIVNAPFLKVVEVLKHEMAHQFVDEYLCRKDNRPHGDLFKEACRILEVSENATYDESAPQDKYLEKIEKLLALSTSMNQHEAELALMKAQELSFKYNISPKIETKNHFQCRPLGSVRKRIPVYEWTIIDILTNFYFVKGIKCTYPESYDIYREAEFSCQFEIYGIQHNIELAEYVYYFLLNNGEQLWNEYRKKVGSRSAYQKNSFMSGVFNGFRQKLRFEQEELKKKFAIIKIDDSALEGFYLECNPNIRTRKVSSTTNSSVYVDGLKEGEKLKINHGVNVKSNGSRGYLLEDKK